MNARVGLLVLLLSGAPLRAADTRVPSLPKIEAALGTGGGRTAYVRDKVLAHLSAGGTLALPAKAGGVRALRRHFKDRMNRSNLAADAIIEGYARAYADGKSRGEWVQKAESALVGDGIFISHGREKMLGRVFRDEEPDLVAARAARRAKLGDRALAKARAEARKLVARMAGYWARGEEAPERWIARGKDLGGMVKREPPPDDPYFGLNPGEWR